MRIAVEGCCHGRLDDIYDTLNYAETVQNVKVIVNPTMFQYEYNIRLTYC